MGTDVNATGQYSFRQVTLAFLGTGTMVVCLNIYYILGQGEIENVSEDTCQLVRACSEYPVCNETLTMLDCCCTFAPTVGHCHPSITQAATTQMELLNANSHFLHDNIVQYADRLAATLPDKLSVFYFVNSG
uniref:Uncharacterized protein n=1 Tax=Salmo trutta TaxID=8032 RepID=A0A673YN49_SALTR